MKCPLVIPLFALLSLSPLHAEPVSAEIQPLAALSRRVVEAIGTLGEPLSNEQRSALEKAIALPDAAESAAKIQEAFDARTLFVVTINPEMRVKAVQGPAKAELVEQGWRLFLVKVINEAGTTAPLAVTSPQAARSFNVSSHTPDSELSNRERWLDFELYDKPPMRGTLSGAKVDYALISVYSRDAGKLEGRFTFDVGQGTQDLGFRSDCDVLFQSLPARELTLHVKDEKGQPCMASFIIHDPLERTYPAQTKRLAPDFWFQPQVYRTEGEKIRLPDGHFTVFFSRGPESIVEKREIDVNGDLKELSFQVKRWIDPAAFGWISSDHHIHAAGCRHYSQPTQGVLASDMARHCQGEDLRIGANLTWGPCFDFQKQFFTGKEDATSQWPYLLRYDIEVSGFGSQASGHLCLLGLKEQMYPGGDSTSHWPTLGLNTLRWAKKQGAVCGPAHSGNGLRMPDDQLPGYAIPPFDGIGANEMIMDITHEVPGPDGQLVPAIDFMSTADTPATWELNFWYHTLNAGYRPRISGETDFPCVTGERVGLGRGYMKLPGHYTYQDWCNAIHDGRGYVGDGLSHLMDFKVNNVAVGEPAAAGQPPSELRLKEPGTIEITAKVGAMLPAQPMPTVHRLGFVVATFGQQLTDLGFPTRLPDWHLEKARIGSSREVPVEVIINGIAVAKQVILANGTLRDVKFSIPVTKSSWVALRILPSSHTNPVFVLIGDKPIRASRRSLDWCLKCVDACWAQKQKTYAPAELAEARAAYDHAREAYRTRLAEAEGE